MPFPPCAFACAKHAPVLESAPRQCLQLAATIPEISIAAIIRKAHINLFTSVALDCTLVVGQGDVGAYNAFTATSRTSALINRQEAYIRP